jgi:hypothetical protein
LIDHDIQKFEGTPNINTNPLPPHTNEDMDIIEAKGDDQVDFTTSKAPWNSLFHALRAHRYLGLVKGREEPRGAKEICKFHSRAQGHGLENCERYFKAQN